MTLDHSYFEEMEAKIPHGKVRTRFAPSPTGYMHVGNLRTALYTWLIARSHDGTFILRIEDTDQSRQVEGAVDVIYRTMAECGLTHDEGPDVGGPVAPYIQSQRRDTYGKYARLLVEKGGAYYCFCEKTESEEDSGEFDRAADPCRELTAQQVQEKLEAQGERYADMVVQVAFGVEKVVFGRQDGSQQFLGRCLSVCSGDTDNRTADHFTVAVR